MRKFAGITTKYQWVQPAVKVSAIHLRCISFSKLSLLVFCTAKGWLCVKLLEGVLMPSLCSWPCWLLTSPVNWEDGRNHYSFSGSHFPSLKVETVRTGGAVDWFWVDKGRVSSWNCHQIGVGSEYPGPVEEDGPKEEVSFSWYIKAGSKTIFLGYLLPVPLQLPNEGWVYPLKTVVFWHNLAHKCSEQFVPSKHTKKDI